MSWIKVGKVTSAHGLNGEIVVLVFSKEISWKKNLKQFAISPKDIESLDSSDIRNFYRQTVKSIANHPQGLRVTVENISNRDQAEALVGQFFYIEECNLISKKNEAIFLREIKGFSLVNQANHFEKPSEYIAGTIVGFSSNGPQDLLVVQKQSGTKYEVPFVEAFLKKIDFENSKVFMELPLGLDPEDDSDSTANKNEDENEGQS